MKMYISPPVSSTIVSPIIKEILNGERKSKNMDNELKETLLKVADYNELEKQRAARSGNISFCIMFLICAMTIIVQMLMTDNISLIMGETVVHYSITNHIIGKT